MRIKKLKQGVPPPAIKRIIRDFFGRQAEVTSISLCRGGLFNTTYRVSAAGHAPVILRFAPPPSKPLLDLERSLLMRERSISCELLRSGIPVPKVLSCDFTRKLINRDYMLVEFKEGMNWFSHMKKLSVAENRRIYGQLGEIAGDIHCIKSKKGLFGFPEPFRKHKKWSGFIRERMSAIIRDMKKWCPFGFSPGADPLKIAEKMAPVLDEVREPSLVHGDLWPRNILIVKDNGRYRINALLDSDRGLWGDPYFEWVFLVWKMPRAFWAGYRNIQDSRGAQLRHRLYRGYYLLQAAIEEDFHFGRKKAALGLFRQAEAAFRELGRKV